MTRRAAFYGFHPQEVSIRPEGTKAADVHPHLFQSPVGRATCRGPDQRHPAHGGGAGRSDCAPRLHAQNAEQLLASKSTRRKSPIVRQCSRLSGSVREPRKAAASGLVKRLRQRLAGDSSPTAEGSFWPRLGPEELAGRLSPHTPVRPVARLLAAARRRLRGERAEEHCTARRLDSEDGRPVAEPHGNVPSGQPGRAQEGAVRGVAERDGITLAEGRVSGWKVAARCA